MQTGQALKQIGKEGGARLGGARADFVASLGRKVAALRTLLGRVREEPADAAVREELRRKLHALGSASKMMKFDAMDRAIADGLGRIDRTPPGGRLDEVDLDALEQMLEDLPALAWGDGNTRSSHVQEVQRTLEPDFSALVVGTPLIAEALLDTAEPGRPVWACQSTPDAQAAFELARANEPDLVVLDADVDDAAELVEALMDDPKTEAIPIVVVGSFVEPGQSARFVAMGVAKTLAKPTSRELLRTTCDEAVGVRRALTPAHAVLGEPTLEELGERLATELREALVGRADAGSRALKIPLGEGTEVLGALWGAIARVREVVTARTFGEVMFAGGPEGALAIAPDLHDPEVPRSDRVRTRRGPAAEVRLTGRRVVVADDDPAVVWFMADLLKTAGCVVHEAFDGREALEAAYRTSPDLVVSDILMPELDGFSLCRALRRDVALRDVPVILLSWKEDLLQRVRELGAGAAGYVRKESDTRAILARVREALRARARVEARLREDGEIRGRLDGVSVRTLLEIVCATRPEARVSVRDASFLYEVEIRMGAPQRATRTSGDGSFLRGSRVLAAMLGVGAGRFTVASSTTTIEPELDGNLASLLAKPIARARAATGLLTGPRRTSVGRVLFDEEALEDYLRATPDGARALAKELAAGASPGDLVSQGACDATLLEDLVCDLTARGVVIGVEDQEGKDLLGPAFDALLRHTDTRASFAPRFATPAPAEAAGEHPEACADDATSPRCESPSPGPAASLADAVMREVLNRSPEPAQLELPRIHAAAPQARPEAEDASAPPPGCEDEGTPPHDQILALAEPTLVDDTVYAEREPSIPITEASRPIDAADERADAEVEAEAGPQEEPGAPEMTPFAAETAEAPAPAPKKSDRKLWPMIAFVVAVAVLAWAVMHMSGPEAPKAVGAAAPPAEQPIPNVVVPDNVSYSSVATEAELPAGQGVLEVTAPADKVLVVDGAERGRGTATLPLWPGSHDVRVKKDGDERGCTVEVRSGRVAHVRF